MHPGGTPALLKQKLSDRKLDRQVNLIAFGDFRTASLSRKYQVAFCGACHHPAEIRANVPALHDITDSGNYLMLFDDILSEEQLTLVLVCSIIQPEIARRLCKQDRHSKIAVACRGAYARCLNWIAPSL